MVRRRVLFVLVALVGIVLFMGAASSLMWFTTSEYFSNLNDFWQPFTLGGGLMTTLAIGTITIFPAIASMATDSGKKAENQSQ